MVEVLRESLSGIVEPTCKLVESVLVASYDASSDACMNEAQVLGSICGCPARDRHCQICEDESIPLAFYKSVIPQLLEPCSSAFFLRAKMYHWTPMTHCAKENSLVAICAALMMVSTAIWMRTLLQSRQHYRGCRECPPCFCLWGPSSLFTM